MRSNIPLLDCLYPEFCSLNAPSTLLLYTHCLLCTKKRISEMNKGSHNCNLVKFRIAEVAETGSYLLLNAHNCYHKALSPNPCKLLMQMGTAAIQ